MSEESTSVAPSDVTYQPPTGGANYDQQALAALVEKMVSERMSSMGVEAPKPPPTPEEAARAFVDSKGFGLGIEERFAAIITHLDLLLKKAGI